MQAVTVVNGVNNYCLLPSTVYKAHLHPRSSMAVVRLQWMVQPHGERAAVARVLLWSLHTVNASSGLVGAGGSELTVNM